MRRRTLSPLVLAERCGWLVKIIKGLVSRDTDRLGSLREIEETGGVSIRSFLVKSSPGPRVSEGLEQEEAERKLGAERQCLISRESPESGVQKCLLETPSASPSRDRVI